VNEQLQTFARDTIKEGLALLSESHRLIFKKMYSHEGLDVDINHVVNTMPENKLDWAMRQIMASLGAL
jgi:hypothetical protein